MMKCMQSNSLRLVVRLFKNEEEGADGVDIVAATV